MTNPKRNTLIRVISVIVDILLLVGIVGIVYAFTNGFNEDFKTFYVEYDGKRVLTSESEATFRTEQTITFDVKYTFDSGNTEPRGYGVKVMPNTKLDFSFKAGGKQYLYADAKELTSAFGIKKEASAFTLSIPKDFTLKTALEKAYGKTVEVEEPTGYPYILVISSYNEKVTYKITFGIVVNVSGIEVDKDGIVFGDVGSQSESTAEYEITYEIAYSFADTLLTVTLPSKSRAGETVAFTAIPEKRYYGVWAEVYDKASGSFLYYATTVSYGNCTFEMPACNVLLKIYHV